MEKEIRDLHLTSYVTPSGFQDATEQDYKHGESQQEKEAELLEAMANTSIKGDTKFSEHIETKSLDSDELSAVANKMAEFGLPETDVQFMYNKISEMTVDQAREILLDTLEKHRDDRNLPDSTRQLAESLLNDEDVAPRVTEYDREFAMKAHAALIYYHSPYPEVRAVTDPYDNEDELCETPRAYVLGFIWVIIGSGVNQFFEPRNPQFSIPASLFQLLILPCGWVWAYIMPDWGFKVWNHEFRWNPGPWTPKEQVLVTLMFNVTAQLAYINSQIFVQKMPFYYGNKWVDAGYQITLLLSTQFMGFALAGLMRSILVYPAHNLWMANFPTLALNRSLMTPDTGGSVHGWKIPRYSFFGIVFGCTFLYQWLPSYLMQFLSTFNWMTWIAPSNFNLAAITGSASGLGVNPISTFDWTIMQISTPLITPFFSQTTQLVGALLAGCVLIPAVYYSNMYYTGYLPINDNHIYDNTGKRYNVSLILSGNSLFDAKKYEKYSPPYWSAANLIVYGSFFAAYTCIFVRSLLYDWRPMVEGFKEVYDMFMFRGKGIKGFNDAQSRMMHKYPETPFYWYVAVLLTSIALGIVSIKCWPTETPVWGIFFALGLGVLFLVPIGFLYAQTNAMFSLNVLTELIAGYALPGRGIALMIIKAFGLNINLQAIYFLQDLKLGHYAKIPPRATFRAQITSSFLASFVVLGVVNWQISNIEGICTQAVAHSSRFTCPNETTYFAASVLWGVIGPKRVFDSLYPVLKWCFLIGAGVPIPFWLLDRYVPAARRYVRYMDPNLIIFGMLQYFAPYNLAMIVPSWYMSLIFMRIIRTRYLAWFEKYNYILSAALTAGSALSLIIIFFSVQYHPKELSWWGNDVPYAGVDGDGSSGWLPIPERGYFGPGPGEYKV
ncbi:Oligopeptide transporter 2 [Wickerhamiella sorbophila]|uniref:Oligopeptide transporter 2 n=1 Tax=Wickerhamiella sorbophila TaxID=45607 RepID=A0A2T0FH42_9ASCO|nr:Oligopeptide transporter 2 [Wickerhamiella sorbophila]PRT54318.1 Oligopeptide transporter 2 [Wickerhamiella sorbophila]